MYFRLWKLQIWAIFLFKFKMGHKAVAITHNISDTFGPGTANEHIVQWRFKKFCKGDESLEDEELSGQPLEIDNNQLRAIIEAESSYNYMSCQRTQCWPFNGYLAFEVNWKGEKLNKCVPHEQTANQKNLHFEVLSPLILCNNNEPLLNPIIMCNERWILFDNHR